MTNVFGYYQSYSSGRQDSLSPLYIFGAIAILFLIGWIWGAINRSIERQAKATSDRIIEARKAEVDNYSLQKNREADKYQKSTLDAIFKAQDFLDNTRLQFDTGYIAGRRWLAQFIADAETADDEALIGHLRNKSRPAVSASDHVKTANQRRRAAIAEKKFLEYQLATYKEYFPALAEYEEIILGEIGGFERGNDLDDTNENIDRAALFLSPEEYKKLSSRERSQKALDGYRARSKSPLEIGRAYERYLGYLYEMGGWDVDFHGALKGFEDLGRDLICIRKDEVHVVQAKCWSQTKIIHEKHLFQLYGTCLHYQIVEKKSVSAIFATTTQLSEVAALAAQYLGITVWNQKLEREYPLIKCNINQGNCIYHLPFDQQYDRVKIRIDAGEFYALTVDDAEGKGFRRAKRYMPPKGSRS